MGFEKIKYNTGKEIFKVRIEDTTGALIQNWVFMKEDFPEWLRIMERKFGVKTKKKEPDRDLDWAR
jgi:hypothetical protein